MNATTSALDAIAVQAKRAQQFAGFAQLAADADPLRAEDMARQAVEAAGNVLQGLLSLGARRPGAVIARDVVPLELLDTDATRELLAALENAARLGAAVDRERGWLDADGDCTGFGQVYQNEADKLRAEVYGAVSRLE